MPSTSGHHRQTAPSESSCERSSPMKAAHKRRRVNELASENEKQKRLLARQASTIQILQSRISHLQHEVASLSNSVPTHGSTKQNENHAVGTVRHSKDKSRSGRKSCIEDADEEECAFHEEDESTCSHAHHTDIDSDAEEYKFAENLLISGVTKWPPDVAIADPEALRLGDFYCIEDWSVCLWRVRDDSTYEFKSVEQHYSIGHIFFVLTVDQIKSGIVKADDVFGSEEQARKYLDEPSFSSETLDPAYWDSLFSADREENLNTEWLLSFAGIGKYMIEYLTKSDRILILACGNSDFSPGVYNAGFHKLVNTDISPVVIEHMRATHGEKSGMTWEVQDALSMSYGDECFDSVLDKSLLDCMFYVEGFAPKLEKMLAEAYRVLKPGRHAVFLSTRNEADTVPFLSRQSWDIEVKVVAAPCDEEGRVSRETIAVPIEDSQSIENVEWGLKNFYLYYCQKR